MWKSGYSRLAAASDEPWQTYVRRTGMLASETGARVILRPLVYPTDRDECRAMEELWHELTCERTHKAAGRSGRCGRQKPDAGVYGSHANATCWAVCASARASEKAGEGDGWCCPN